MLAIQNKLYSDDPDTLWEIDAIMDFTFDLMNVIFKLGKSITAKMVFEPLFTLLEKRFDEHKKRFSAGTSKPTLADFVVAGYYFTGTNPKNASRALIKETSQLLKQFPKTRHYLCATLRSELKIVNPLTKVVFVCPKLNDGYYIKKDLKLQQIKQVVDILGDPTSGK
jgi:hypothetical protein